MASDNDRENQLLEIEALESVFRASKIQKISDWTDASQSIQGFLQVDFDSITGEPIELRGLPQGRSIEFVHVIKFLPPISLKFELPVEYPSSSSPKIEIHSNWMTHKQITTCEEAIERTLAENAGMIVLYLCWQAVVDAVGSLKIEFINLNRAFFRQKNIMFPILVLRDSCLQAISKSEEEVFQTSCYTCAVCFESNHGKDCVKFLPCHHIFCTACVHQYYQHLSKGMITQRMQCLSDGCATEASDEIVREALGSELYDRYDEALLQKAIREWDDETMECARASCKMISYVTDREKNLVECSYCSYNFCKLCKHAYHGVSSCEIRTKELAEVLNKYVDGTEEEKAELENKYGKAIFEELIDAKLNREWISNNTKPCSICWVNVEKIDGCNKMTCTNCGGNFCWLCLKPLQNGYLHFNSGPCNKRLFDGLED